ncbi:hypothetical protein [Caenibacillus caldisaponilyticus]|uniref:hypothetical protein n=1 Tax=Caenibacillus caldisaponilyticus TaxID=1674942 RepID=UPI0009886281|nr:hypothetical protein [Caenibacillus caldisaponilyticus]
MEKDWITAYICKLTKHYYNMEIVNNWISNLVNDINSALSEVGKGKADFDKEENIVVFPDSIIEFTVNENALHFTKLTRENKRQVGKIIVLTDGLSYKIKDERNETIAKVNEIPDMINNVFSYLLVTMRER